MTTPTAEEFRNVIADELEALAKRVREPTTRVEKALKTGKVSITRDNEMTCTSTNADYRVSGDGWAAVLEVVEAP